MTHYLGLYALVALTITALILTPRLHDWSEDRMWEALLQEARDCTAARDES